MDLELKCRAAPSRRSNIVEMSNEYLRRDTQPNNTFLGMLIRAANSPESRNFLNFAHKNIFTKKKRDKISYNSEQAVVLVHGLAMSSHKLPSGKRQILKIITPGELCNPWVFHGSEMRMELAACSQSRLINLPVSGLMAANEDFSSVCSTTAGRDHLRLIEKIVSLGRHTARERVVLFLLDLVERLQLAGLARDDSFDVGVTQYEMADAIGLCAVHVNRAVADMKLEGLITTSGRRYQICNRAKMEKIVSFDIRQSYV